MPSLKMPSLPLVILSSIMGLFIGTRFENLHSYADTLAWFQCVEDRKASASA